MKYRLLLIITVLLLSSCYKNVLFDESKTIPDATWKISEPVKFTVPITDSVQGYDFYFNLRNATDYGYANVFFFVHTLYPNGKTSVDTVQCLLADPTGKWLGNRHGKYVDNRILFRKNVCFTQKGNYSFEFEQAMRTDELKGIENFGIRIEKSENK